MKKFLKWALILFIGFFLLSVLLNIIGGDNNNSSTDTLARVSNQENSDTQTAVQTKEEVVQKAETKLDSVEMANCAAAALKSQEVEVFSKWFNALEQKYTVIYPDKSKKEIEAYTDERIMDKKKRLQNNGYDSKPAFNKYYQMNCAEFEPK
ncbi:hypothetical protein OHW42_19780 [Acinetobacter baumannii]|nr:hypothetical protein [Acinetobacter baumannii]MCZ3322712.1 hypothetical protein [Acinetobacter baumannii]MDC5156186.1 hypothetical protein [Acinetobacter baumannii]HEM7282277.1 hypothetical protein [Acinetobacter nosocomialis]HEM8327005.1 hypothetical protein [Acinetobacter nosocomialis]